MATVVIMPRQGQSVESCVITKWHKNVGERVNVGDELFSYETDKATFDEEAKTEGVLLAVFFDEGDDVVCLTNVCVIGEQGEDFSGFRPHEAGEGSVLGKAEVEATFAASPDAASASAPVSRPSPTFVPITVADEEGCVKISPRARALAERSGIAAERAIPTGPGGRIIERDVGALIIESRRATPVSTRSYDPHSPFFMETDIDGGMAAEYEVEKEIFSAPTDLHKEDLKNDEFEIVELSNVRKTIAKAMHASLMNTAQVTLNTSFDASDILEFRKKNKILGESFNLPMIGITDIIVFAASRTLAARNSHKNLNAHFLEDNKMKIFKDAHIGVAVDTPRGLLVPTIFGASRMTLLEISTEARRLYSMCSQGSICPDLLQGASFTISNLGALGIESFTPILNPPQTGILGVCAVIERRRGGKAYPAMGLSLTFDHRALDGASAAQFLKDLVGRLENFSAYAVLGGS